jgi:hypothetical protein
MARVQEGSHGLLNFASYLKQYINRLKAKIVKIILKMQSLPQRKQDFTVNAV